jgi:GNAT superfamily N-acetyltransferase
MQIRQVRTKQELRQVYDMSLEYTNNHQTWREYLAQYKRYPDLFFGAWEKDKLIGEVFGFRFVEGVITLHSIAVFGTEWKKGIGAKLLKTFENAVSKYSSKVNVTSGREVESFYEHLGWKPRGLLAVYEEGKRLPENLSLIPLETHFRRRDKTIFPFFVLPQGIERTDFERELGADEVNLVLEKILN